MPCTVDAPCGGVFFLDRGLNDELAQWGLPQRAGKCLNGHALFAGIPLDLSTREALSDPVCSEHEQPRPCPECADERRDRRRLVIATRRATCVVCGRPVPRRRFSFCSSRCATGYGARQSLGAGGGEVAADAGVERPEDGLATAAAGG